VWSRFVDVSALDQVEVSEDRAHARLGAGATVLPTYQALWPYKVAIQGGTCPTAGITGLTTGGVLGVLGRVHGLTCDSLVRVELGTAGGEPLRASEDENSDLFWALRGGCHAKSDVAGDGTANLSARWLGPNVCHCCFPDRKRCAWLGKGAARVCWPGAVGGVEL
jgi:FAD/FMN-containing dehydrogenase